MGGWTGSNENQTRDSLLDAAEHLIRHQRPESVSMKCVAREAGISRTMIYQHFTSRESMFAAVSARIVRSMNIAMERHISGLKGFRKVRASSHAMALYRRDNPEKMAVLQKLRSVKVHDPCDENVRELIRLVRANQRILAEAVRESGGNKEFIAGIDPMATGQFLRMALQDACGLPPVHMALLDMQGARSEDFLKNTRDPLYRSILISPDN